MPAPLRAPLPKNSRHTVRVCAGMRCTIQRALVIRPSQPSFWTPGRPARNLSVTSLPRPSLRKAWPGISRRARCARASCRRRRSAAARSVRDIGVVDLARGCGPAARPRATRPRGVTMRHAGQVVERGAPQHGLLAAGVHRDVAADAARPRPRSGRPRTRGRPRSAASITRWVTTPASVADRGHRLPDAGQLAATRPRSCASSFSVLMTALLPGQRHRAAGVAGAAAARDDGQAELDAARAPAPAISASLSGVSTTNGYSTRQSVASVTCETRAQAVELDVVARGDAAQQALARLARSARDLVESGGKALDRRACAAASSSPTSASRSSPAACGASRPRARRCRSASTSSWRRLRVVEQVVLAGRGCAARPRCRPAPRTACAPSGRCGARRAARRAAVPGLARRAGGARSRGRRTRCSCRGSRAGAPACQASPVAPNTSW